MAEEEDEEAVSDSIAETIQTARVGLARIERAGFQAKDGIEEAIDAALRPTTKVTRHGRTWLLGQTQRDGDSLTGRIGFQIGMHVEIWSEADGDFVPTAGAMGLTSPFAIDLTTQRVVFQLRPGQIRVRSFTGALQALMNEADPVGRWRVTPDLVEIPFSEWRERVDRVVELRLTLKEPNPHYKDRLKVRSLIEGANARMVTLVLQADRDSLDGLDLNDEFIREALEHAKEHGKFSSKGETAHGMESWGSNQEAATEVRERPADAATGEVSGEELKAELAVVRDESD